MLLCIIHNVIHIYIYNVITYYTIYNIIYTYICIYIYYHYYYMHIMFLTMANVAMAPNWGTNSYPQPWSSIHDPPLLSLLITHQVF